MRTNSSSACISCNPLCKVLFLCWINGMPQKAFNYNCIEIHIFIKKNFILFDNKSIWFTCDCNKVEATPTKTSITRIWICARFITFSNAKEKKIPKRLTNIKCSQQILLKVSAKKCDKVTKRIKNKRTHEKMCNEKKDKWHNNNHFARSHTHTDTSKHAHSTTK